MKKCKMCLETFSIENFLISKYKVNGDPVRRTCCKACHSKRVNARKSRKPLTTVISLENEVWLDIKGFEGIYAVSNMGRVKSLAREKKDPYYTKRVLGEKLLKQFMLNSGYFVVHLKNSELKINTNFLVHRLVALAFIENIDNKEQVNHIDGVKTNNRLENLEWLTRSENIKHAIKLGLMTPEKNLWKSR
jgi:hypothetical protein